MLLSSLAWLFLLCNKPLYAQTPPPGTPAEEGAGEGDRQPPTPPPSVEEAAAAWSEAWAETPDVPTGDEEGDGLLETEEEIQDRLHAVNRQIFSNREWRAYWENQQETGKLLVAALLAEWAAAQEAGEEEAAPTEAGEDGEPAAPQEPLRVRGMRSWIALAKEKADNQDHYFEALQSERDSLEDRLEDLLDSDEGSPSEEAVVIEDPTPYQKRAQHLAALQDRIEVLSRKRAEAEQRKQYINLQLEGEQLLMAAMQADVALARREATLAAEQSALPTDALSRTWRKIAQAAAGMEAKIEAAISEFERLQREHEVEMRLIDAEISFRQERIDELQQQLETDGDTATLLTATQETVVEWLKERGTRIVLTLSLIWLVVLFSLRLMGRVTNVIASRAGAGTDQAAQQRRKTLMDVFSSIARIVVYGLAVLIALEQLGVDIGPLLGSVAILGLAVSFGSQNLVRDLVSGFFILLENQYTIDDKVIINGHKGRIEKITLRSTWVRHRMSGDLHIIPNGEISEVTNRSRDWAKAIIDIGIGYNADLDHAKVVMNRVGKELFETEGWDKFLVTAPQWWGVLELGDSCVVVRALAEVKEGKTLKVIKEMNYRLKKAFDAEGIEIPYPQMVIHRAE